MFRTSMAVSLIFLAGLGCASRDARTADFVVRSAPLSDRAASLDAAEAALVSLGYTVAKRDRAGGVIVTESISMEGTSERTLRADNPKRKIAEVRIVGSGDTMKLHCKVVIQEQMTESYRLLAFERGGDDLPGHQTAIDRDAATTADQNTVWRTMSRDRVAEREILDRISAAGSGP